MPLYRDVVELFARSGTAHTLTLLALYGGPWAENHFYEGMSPQWARFEPSVAPGDTL